MNELNSGLALRINQPGWASHTLGDYLPDAFGPQALKIKTLLMDVEDHGFTPRGDTLAQAAITAASLSGFDYADITRAVLAERADAALTQWDATVATLRALGCEEIDRVT